MCGIHAELYVRLLCRFAPDNVLAHVTSYHDYAIDKILELCRSHGCDEVGLMLEFDYEILYVYRYYSKISEKW